MRIIATITLTLVFALITWGSEPSTLDPKTYLKLHIQARNPSGPEWEHAMAQLMGSGDAFTIETLQGLKAHQLKSKSAATVASVMDAARKRIKTETTTEFVKHIEPWLQAAALADVTCSPLEGVLVSWVLKTVRQNLDRPGVRAELARVQKTPAVSVEGEAWNALAHERAKSYVDRILNASSSDSVGGARLQ